MRKPATASALPLRAALLASVLATFSGCSPGSVPVEPPREEGGWVRVPSTTETNLNAVWGTGPRDVWFVGENGHQYAAVGTALHWDGVEVRDVALPAEPGCPPGSCRLRCVWGRGPDDVFALGGSQAAFVLEPALRWNGAAWSFFLRDPPVGLPDGWFDCGRGAGEEVWLAGSLGVLARWNGAEWSIEEVQVESTNPYRDGWIAGFWRSEEGEFWAVGHTSRWSDSSGLITHRDETGWHESLSTVEQLEGVWGADPSNVWVVGSLGTILRWNGREWAAAPNDSPGTLRAVWGSSATDVWAVGDDGVILHWDGQSWSTVPSGTTATLRGVWGSGPTDVWAVGDEGTILRWSGERGAAAGSQPSSPRRLSDLTTNRSSAP